MGMGLSICRSIIEAHEGRLWVAPNTPCGTVFHFILPTDTAVPAGRHEEGNPATSHPPA
jgi:signal transduction histidine kinase